MNIHEYQAKEILRSYGAPVAKGHRCWSPTMRARPSTSWAGRSGWSRRRSTPAAAARGRSRNPRPASKGGVRVTKDPEEAVQFVRQMLGNTLVTKQTGPAGKQVGRVYVEQGAAIAREYYLALLVDRETSRVAFIASTEGGMDIEEVAASTPEKIVTLSVDPATGIQPYHGRKLATALRLEGEAVRQAGRLAGTLYRAFLDKDVSLLEINPLIQTEAGDLVCLDAKMNFDSNALYRHKDLVELRDETEEDPKELEASKHDLNYIALDGEIGCMVNGAGLAMATMDIIKLYGVRAGELPRRRRRRHQGEGDRGFQDHHQRPEGEGHPGQHLRRHHALRRHRRGRGRRRQAGGAAGAAGGAPGRHERRARQADPRTSRMSRSPPPTTWRTPPRRSSRRCGGEHPRKRRGRFMSKLNEEPIREAPLIAGAALVVCGVLLMRLGPDLLAMPAPREARQSALARLRRGDRTGAVAQRLREALVEILPANVLGGVGRGLVLAGAGVLIVRLLDHFAGDGGARR